MPWKHYRNSARGTVTVTNLETDLQTSATYSVSTVSTGRSQVFYGYAVELTCCGTRYIGEDRYSIRHALRDLAEKLSTTHLSISVAGLSDAFEETGLSGNTGFGYLRGRKSAIHMMEEISPRSPTNPSGQ